MARQPDIHYIQFYTDGSAARKIQTAQPQKAVVAKPRPRKQKRIVVRIDPIATMGILVAALMLVLMAVGVAKLRTAQQEVLVMEQYVNSLQEENASLGNIYETGYDMQAVEDMALALGMVPKEQAPNTLVVYSVPQEVIQLSLWDRITVFFAGLFA